MIIQMSTISFFAKPFLKNLHKSIDDFDYNSIYLRVSKLLKENDFSDEEIQKIFMNMDKVISDNIKN